MMKGNTNKKMWNPKSVISGPVYSSLSTQLLSYEFVVKKVQSASLCNKNISIPSTNLVTFFTDMTRLVGFILFFNVI
jgi:hypothetical protein